MVQATENRQELRPFKVDKSQTTVNVTVEPGAYAGFLHTIGSLTTKHGETCKFLFAVVSNGNLIGSLNMLAGEYYSVGSNFMKILGAVSGFPNDAIPEGKPVSEFRDRGYCQLLVDRKPDGFSEIVKVSPIASSDPRVAELHKAIISEHPEWFAPVADQYPELAVL